jgi:hypothetical protein
VALLLLACRQRVLPSLLLCAVCLQHQLLLLLLLCAFCLQQQLAEVVAVLLQTS